MRHGLKDGHTEHKRTDSTALQSDLIDSQTPPDAEDDDEAPETPTDEPPPVPITDPPPSDAPRSPPYVVRPALQRSLVE
jgi:hypothetical protein